jgi:hypothetical protein
MLLQLPCLLKKGLHGIAEGDEHLDDIAEEVWCTPPVPHTGPTFGTKEEEKSYYNAYAKRFGFSIRISATRLSTSSRQQHKVIFVCNKEGHGRKAKKEVDDNSSTGTESDSEDEDDVDGEEAKKKKLDGRKKRKRERMLHTGCKARMVVNLIENRWHVTYFLADHNYDVVVKPSLKKFLRSQKGILQAEKEFITLLHGCNLTSGRIMQLMNEMYGSAQIVPYGGKDISNFRSNIRRTDRYKDMQQTIDRFREIQADDPNFYCKVKLDDRDMVESIFWLIGQQGKLTLICTITVCLLMLPT